jgi:hypothetical protein
MLMNATESSSRPHGLGFLPTELWAHIASYLAVKDFRSLVLTHRKAASLTECPVVVARIYHNTWLTAALSVIMHGNLCASSRVVGCLLRIWSRVQLDESTVAGTAILDVAWFKQVDPKHAAIIERIIQLGAVLGYSRSFAALQNAMESGCVALVERIVDMHGGLHDSWAIDRAIGWASQNGHFGIIERILQLPNLDTERIAGVAACAAEFGHAAIIERLGDCS